MSYEAHNLVSGSADGTGWVGFGNVTVQTGDPISATTSDTSSDNMNAILTSPLSVTSGTPYTLTAEIKATPNCFVAATGMVSLTKGILAIRGLAGDISTEWTHISVTLTPSDTESNAIVAFLVASNDGSPASLYVRNLMLVKGTSPAAWAPAEGETLAGGGASMSANLLDGVSPVLIKDVSLGADGELSFSTYAGSYDERQLVYELPFVGKLDANQTFHFGVSAIAGGGTSTLFVKLSYADSAGNTNMAVAKIVVTTTYARHETSLVIPSGMTIKDLLLSRGENEKIIKIQPPTLSYGSPVTLAMAQASAANVDDGKSPTVSVSKSGTVTTITVHNADGSTTTQKVNDGTNGTPGAKGADGKTTYLHVKYSNDNGATFTANSGETVGTYIGTCTDFNSADPTSVSSYKWARIKGDTGAKGDPGAKGETGATGATGNGISSVTVTYGVSSSASAQPSSWQTTVPTVPQGQYLWTRTVTDYTDPSAADTVTYTYALQGKDGAKGATGNPGATGAPGKDGTSVKVSSIQYQVGTSGTTPPTGTWSNSVLATSVGQYLWTKTTFSDGNVAYGVAAHGSTGPQGAKGADGKSPTVSISKSGTTTTITVHNVDGSTSTQTVKDGTNGTPGAKGADGRTQYLHVKYSNDNGSTFTSNSGETVGSYIGTCTDFNEADPTSVSSYKWARIKGDTGAKGDPGAKGETGATGVGVKSSTVTYQSSSSGTTIPTGTWSSGIPSVPEGSFLWTRIVYSYSNGTSTTAYSVGKMGAKGDKGATGNTGAPGAAGRGIKSSNVTYQAGNSQTTVPTGSWVTSVPKLSSATPYLWTRTILTYTDNTTSTAYSVGTTLDGVNVGGRNLLLDSGTLIKHSDDGNSLRNIPTLANETYDSNNVTKQTKTNNAATDVLHWNVKDCKPGACYTFSFYVKGSCEKINAFFYGPNGYIGAKPVKTSGSISAATGFGDGNTVFAVSSEWKRVWVTYELSQVSEATKTNDKFILIRMDSSVTGKDVYVSSPKLELGNTATDWSPAPEDVATDIADAANTAANALEKANNNEKNITEATKAILNIQENIKALVTGPNGSSLMTQTNKGWTFDMSSIERTLNEATDDITNLNSDLSATNDILNSTKKLLDDVTKKTAYINFATDDSGNPCIELGKQDNPFKLRITNTSIDFMQGSQKIAYLTNHQLYIESSVITDSILIGQNGTFIWKKRANNHLGLRYT